MELKDEISRHQKCDRESSSRVRELEASIARQQEEVEVMQRQVRVLRDEVAEKEGQLTLARMSLDTAEKQNQQHMCQVDCLLLLVCKVYD